MRAFVWGLVCGALGMYWYVFHGHELWAFKRSVDGWRDGAVEQTSGYDTRPSR